MNPDIVIPLNWYSINDYLELKFTLRSIEKHLRNYGNIFLIGQTRPPFINDEITLLNHPDNPKAPSSVNIKNKLLYACNQSAISDPFVMFNDDHYLLREFDAGSMLYYYEGHLMDKYEKVKGQPYGEQILHTYRTLVHCGLRYFDVHFPMEVSKKQFCKVMDFYTWDTPHGYLIKSLYCNSLEIKGTPTTDLVIMGPVRDQERLDNMLEGREFFSTHEGAMKGLVVDKLYELYPEKSRFEL